MTHPMVEKCARAIAANRAQPLPDFVRPWSWEELPSHYRVEMLSDARALLEALLEPDETYVFDREFTAAIRSLLEEK